MSDQPPQTENNQPLNSVRIQIPKRKPVVTYSIIGVTVVVFLIQTIVKTFAGNDILFIYAGKINGLIKAGQFWRLLSPILLHGSVLHITMNMYALYILGRRMERFYGNGRFLLLYILSGFAGNVLSFVLTPSPSLGASTAIFGLFSAEGIFIIQNRKLFGPSRTMQALLNLGIILIINLAYGFAPGTNIDIMGHLGGLIGGVFFAWKAGPILHVAGQPPFFDMVDTRKNNDVLIASLVVIVGFILIALIPFIAG